MYITPSKTFFMRKFAFLILQGLKIHLSDLLKRNMAVKDQKKIFEKMNAKLINPDFCDKNIEFFIFYK